MTRRYRFHSRHEDGFVLVYVLVVLTGLLIMVGLCVDGGRAYLTKAQLTKAVDGAALGAARMLNSGDPRGEAVALFNANFPSGYMGTTGDPTAASNFFSVTTDEANAVNIVRINASVTMPTTFMSLADRTDVAVGAVAKATRRMVDLCLVLDTSGSLGWRWPYVKEAAKAFVQAFDQNGDRFCLVKYSSGADVLEPISLPRGFNKTSIVNEIDNTPAQGFTTMAEGIWRGWDELRVVPFGQQSSLRLIVLFTDGAANGVPGVYDTFPAEARSLNSSDFPDYPPDPDNMTRDSPFFQGLHDTETGVRNPSYTTTGTWDSTWTFSDIPYLPAQSAHQHGRSGGIPTSFPLETASLTVGGVAQSTARGLRN